MSEESEMFSSSVSKTENESHQSEESTTLMVLGASSFVFGVVAIEELGVSPLRDSVSESSPTRLPQCEGLEPEVETLGKSTSPRAFSSKFIFKVENVA